MQLPASGERVLSSTEQDVNARIHRMTRANILYYSQHPDQIDERLREIDEEWDTERVLETNAAGLVLSGTVFAAALGRKWLLLPLVVSGFLLQHGLQGWCPPLPVLRRLGFRTPREIEAERYALKALRGDFDGLSHDADGADAAAQATGRLHFAGKESSNGMGEH